jgi:hypothetical protein
MPNFKQACSTVTQVLIDDFIDEAAVPASDAKVPGPRHLELRAGPEPMAKVGDIYVSEKKSRASERRPDGCTIS